MKDFYDGSYMVVQDGKLRRKRDDTDYICDFCCQPLGASCWTYPCGEMELPLTLDPTGLKAMSDDSWACCHDCQPFVIAKAWKSLAERTFDLQLAASGIDIPIPPGFREEAIGEVVAHFERFDAARLGEPFMEKAPFTEHTP